VVKVGFVRWRSCQYWAPKARESRSGEGASPSPADYGVWGSVVSSPSGVRGRAPAANAFLVHYRVAEGFWWIEKCEYSRVMQKQKFVFLDTKTMRLRRTVNHEIFARVLFSRIGLICKIQYLQIWAIRLRSSLLSTAGTLLVLLCYVFFVYIIQSTCFAIFIANLQRIFWTSNSEIRMHLCSKKFADIRLTIIWYCIA